MSLYDTLILNCIDYKLTHMAPTLCNISASVCSIGLIVYFVVCGNPGLFNYYLIITVYLLGVYPEVKNMF